MKQQIKFICGDVLFEAELPDDTPSGLAARHALEQATKARAYLAGANLAGANLAGANLEGAYLAGVYLDGANLAGANLAGANLAWANLAGANLAGANLEGAYLEGGAKLIGDRPVFMVGPIGSRCAYFTAFITNQGVRVTAGCFKQKTIEEFRVKLKDEHGKNVHAREYEAALTLIERHAEIWTPKEAA